MYRCLLQAIFPHFAILSAAESKKDSFTLQVYDSFKSIIGHECFPDVNTSNSANRARVRAKAVLDTISSFHWLTSACLVRLQKHDSSVIEVLQALIDDINTRPSTLKGLCETFGAQWGISTASLSSASSLQLKPPKQVHNASGSSRSSPKSFKQLLSAKASQDAQSDRNDLGSTTNANIQVEELRKTISQDSIVTSIPEPVASSSDKSLVSEDALISSLPAELAPLKTRNVRDYATSIDKETNFNVMGMTGISDMASQTLNEAAMAASAEIVDSSTETVSSSESEPANIVHSQETGSSRRRSSRLSLPAKTSSSSSAANKIGSRSKRSIELLKPITTTKDGRGNKKSRRSTINTESSDSQHLVALRSTLENTTGDTSTSSWLREWSLQALTSLASLEKKHGL